MPGTFVHRVSRHRRLRLALVLSLCLAALLAAAWLWFRDSGFVSVRSVSISGVSGPGAGAIDAALQRAARATSTLDVNVAALRSAVSPYPQVRGLRVSASFPHTLRISVEEQLPVALLVAPGGGQSPVSAGGVVLGNSLSSAALPDLQVASLPAKRVTDPLLLEYLSVLGGAPSALERFVARIYSGHKGLTVALRNGLLVYFGNGSRPHAKWLAFARVLLAQGPAGAAYVDVRMPEYPAAGSTSAAPGGIGSAVASAPSGARSAEAGSGSLIAGLEALIRGEHGSQGRAEAQGAGAGESTEAQLPAAGEPGSPGAQAGSEASGQSGSEASPEAPAPAPPGR